MYLKSNYLITVLHKVHAIPLFVLLLGLLWMFFPILTGEFYFIGISDRFAHDLAPTYFVNQSLQEGKLPLWNPYIMNGFDFIASPFNQLFYPPHWPLFLVKAELIPYLTGLILFLHLCCFSLGIYLLAYNIYRSKESAFVAATISTFGFSTIIEFSFGSALYSLAWMPYLLLFVAKSTEKKTILKNSTWFALFFTLQLLGGFIQITIYCYLFLFLFTLFLFYQNKNKFHLVVLIVGSIIGVIFSLPKTIFLLTSVSEFTRTMPLEELIYATKAEPSYFIRWFISDFFGSSFSTFTFKSHKNFYETLPVYSSMGGVILAFFSFSLIHRSKNILFFSTVLLLAFAVSFGVKPFFLFLEFITGNNRLFQTRVFILIPICTAFLAAAYIKKIEVKEITFLEVVISLAFILFLLLLLFGLIPPIPPPQKLYGIYVSLFSAMALYFVIFLGYKKIVNKKNAVIVISGIIFLEIVSQTNYILNLQKNDHVKAIQGNDLVFLPPDYLKIPTTKKLETIKKRVGFNKIYIKGKESLYPWINLPTTLWQLMTPQGYLNSVPERLKKLSKDKTNDISRVIYFRYAKYKKLFPLLGVKYSMVFKNKAVSPFLTFPQTTRLIPQSYQTLPVIFAVGTVRFAKNTEQAIEIISSLPRGALKSIAIMEKKTETTEITGKVPKYTIVDYYKIVIESATTSVAVLNQNYDLGWRAKIDENEVLYTFTDLIVFNGIK